MEKRQSERGDDYVRSSVQGTLGDKIVTADGKEIPGLRSRPRRRHCAGWAFGFGLYSASKSRRRRAGLRVMQYAVNDLPEGWHIEGSLSIELASMLFGGYALAKRYPK